MGQQAIPGERIAASERKPELQGDAVIVVAGREGLVGTFQLQAAIQLVVQAGHVGVGAMGEEEVGVRGGHGVAGAEVVP